MSKIRFIHTADLHLDSPFKGMENLPNKILKKIKESTFNSFAKIVDVAIDETVDFVLIVGDIFDGEDRSLMAQTRFRKEIERLYNNKIQVFISHGNHDHLGGNWIEISWPENVHIFSSENVTSKPFVKEGKPIANIYGFSYSERAVRENKTEQYVKSGDAPYHIGMLHGNIDGNSDHDNYAPFTVRELLSKEFSYWALGHIHIKQSLHNNPPIIYPGNIQGRHRKELGEKGCYIVEIDELNTKTTFVNTAPLIWEAIEIAINDITSYDDLCHYCEEKIKTIRSDSKAKLIHLQIIGIGELHHLLQDKQVVEELISYLNEGEEGKDNFCLVTSSKIVTRENWDREALKEKQHFTGEVLKMIESNEDLIEEAISPLFTHRKAKKYLEDLDEERKKELIEKAEVELLMDLLRR
ncbi:metallophosphoesterase family protein [Lottiidibacillus patelloidae]|nr:DNA repair exonuclease [Lottiidibacillus patelloidae]